MADRALFHRPNRTLAAYAFGFTLFLYVPILFIPLFSVNAGLYQRFPVESLTLAWYAELFTRGPVFEALRNSLLVGVSVALISTVLAVPAAKALSRAVLPGKRPVTGFIMLPLIVPGLVFGVALLVVISRLGVPLSLYTVALGHVVICLPFAISILLPRFEGANRSLEEASADLGENGWWTFWRVTFPNILPGVVASLLLTFTVSFDEFIMAFFLSGTDPTLPMYIWTQLRFPQSFPSLLALSTLILAASFALVFLSLWFARMGRTATTLTSR
jgi:spermidine/putrescine transport system permease protein